MTRFLTRTLHFLSADERRQLTAALAAGIVHFAALAALLAMPARELIDVGGEGNVVDVRLYTVAGENAVTDAPLNEPTLAGDDAETDTGGDGDGDDDDDADADQTDRADRRETPEEADEPDASEAGETTEAEPGEPQPEVAPAPETPPDEAERRVDARILTAPGGTGEPIPAERPDAPDTPEPADNGGALATTQTRPPSLRERLRTDRDRPSFADIEARAQSRLDPDEFRLQRYAEGGVDASVEESFCLSSSQANLEAGECGDAPNPNSARLAEFGLSQPGERPPVFLEDLSRLAFELEQLGEDPDVIQEILLRAREARREVLETPALIREMQRDQRNATNRYGLSEGILDDEG